MTDLPSYEEKIRVAVSNSCGYAIFDETDEWPFIYFQIAGLKAGDYPSVAGSVQCDKGSIGELQGRDFFSVEDNAFYHFIGSKDFAIGVYYFPIKYKVRKVRINKCGYLVIKYRDNFPHNRLVSIGDMLFNPSNYPMKTGTPRCKVPRKVKGQEPADYSIGFQQTLNFFANNSFWHFIDYDTELVGVDVPLYYLPEPKINP